jgi:hypothetical protein
MTASELEGAWQTERYVVKGRSHDIEGVLLLTGGRWATLYFVPTSAGPWGSAEAGAYSVDGDRLTFHHELMLQGGGDRTLNVNPTAGHAETCDVQLEANRCTIRFPSGNSLHLRRPS